MVKIKFQNKNYTLYSKGENGNPNAKGYPCIVESKTKQTPKSQAQLLKDVLSSLGVTYTRYKPQDINTHDLVGCVIKMSKLFKVK